MENKPRKRKKRTNPTYLILVGIVLYVSWTFINQQIRLQDMEKEQAVYKKQVQELKEEEESLIHEKNILDDPTYIEKVARERLKMVKPNEIIYIDQEKAKYQD